MAIEKNYKKFKDWASFFEHNLSILSARYKSQANVNRALGVSSGYLSNLKNNPKNPDAIILARLSHMLFEDYFTLEKAWLYFTGDLDVDEIAPYIDDENAMKAIVQNFRRLSEENKIKIMDEIKKL